MNIVVTLQRIGTRGAEALLAPRVSLWIRRAAFFSLLAAGAAVCTYRITGPSLWPDEIYHRWVGQLPMAKIKNYEAFMRFSTAYYVINDWTEKIFRDPTFSARFPAAVAAVMSLVFVYLLGRHLFSTGAGLLAMVLLITNPFFVRFAQENRFYQLGSMGVVASYYFFAKFIETRQRRFGIALVLAASLLMHSFPYGFMAAAMLAPVALLLWGVTAWAGEKWSPYSVSRRTMLMLMVAAVVVILVWMPVPVQLFKQMFLSKTLVNSLKDGRGGGWDGWWQAPFAISDIAGFVAGFVPAVSAKAVALPGVLLVAMACVGSLFVSRGRAFVFVAFYLLSVACALGAMNMVQAAVMGRRFVFVLPALALCAAGGAAMAAVMAGRMVAWCVAAFARRLRLLHGTSAAGIARWLATAAVWGILLTGCFWPVMVNGAYGVVQWYFGERAVHKTFGRLLLAHGGAHDVVCWYDLNGWMLEQYFPYGAIAAPPMTIPRDQMDAALSRGGGVWGVRLTPDRIGIPSNHCVTFSVHCGVGFLARAEFATNAAARAQAQEQILRSVVNLAECPDTNNAAHIISLLAARGLDTEADRIAEHLVMRFPGSRDACDFATRHFIARDNPAKACAMWRRHARICFWMPDVRCRLRALERQCQERGTTDRGTVTSPSGLPAPAGANLLANSDFTRGMDKWRLWQHARAHTNLVSIVQESGSGACARIMNPLGLLVGIEQTVPVLSGAVYRLSADARATVPGGGLGARVAFFLPPQSESHLIWGAADTRWTGQAMAVTSRVTGTAVIYAHLGFAGIRNTGEFRNIKLVPMGPAAPR